MVERISRRADDYSKWYTDVIREAELADYGPVRGTMVVRPYGYAIWENIQRHLDRMFRDTGHQNAYFPMFIPMSFLEREQEHVEGFSPQLAVVTHGGGAELEEPLVVRPTSETIINHMYSKWIQSYRDLPLLINQWCNVVRWELRTRPFLRTLEFLWQEGHTAHATASDATEEALRMLEVYREFAEVVAAVPVVAGRKTEVEKFPGAVSSYTIEAMMGDRRALQAATSHDLGQNFARAFNIQYLDANNELQYVWQTSWGLSTRFVGAVIMVHGDDAGLILPPRLAPIQAVIVPIWHSEDEQAKVLDSAKALEVEMAGQVRVHTDDRAEYRPGWKFSDWELKGVPLRVEIGPRDLVRESVVVVRRDGGVRETLRRSEVTNRVTSLLDDIQHDMLTRAGRFLSDNTHQATSYEEFRNLIEHEGGFIRVHWAGTSEDEVRIKEETGATIRCLPIDDSAETGGCFYTGKSTQTVAVFARAY